MEDTHILACFRPEALICRRRSWRRVGEEEERCGGRPMYHQFNGMWVLGIVRASNPITLGFSSYSNRDAFCEPETTGLPHTTRFREHKP